MRTVHARAASPTGKLAMPGGRRAYIGAVRRAPDTVIDCHIDDVFAFLGDFTNAPRWMEGVVSVQQVAGEAAGPGALYDVVRRARRGQRRTSVVYTAFDPPTRVAWRDDGHEVDYVLEPVWTATRVTAHGGAMRDLRGLRRALEGRRA